MRKPLQPDNKKHMDDEDDSFSIASSLRRAKSGVTHGSAPTFKSAQRAEKRKEVKANSLIYYNKVYFVLFTD